MGRLISVLALVVLLALVVAASACGTDDPFTVENLNSYGVFESVEPGEDFHRVLTHRYDPRRHDPDENPTQRHYQQSEDVCSRKPIR